MCIRDREEDIDEAIDEADWGLGGEELEDDEDIEDDEDWGLGEDDEAAGSVEDYTSKLETELGTDSDSAPPQESGHGSDDNDDVNKVLADNDYALGDKTPEEEPVRKEPPAIVSEQEDVPKVTLSEEASKDLEQVLPDEAASAMEDSGGKRSKLRVILPLFFILMGIAILYYTGLFQNLMGPSGPPPVTLEIHGLKGSFVQNEDIGQLYAVQGRIKNISEESQEVVGVKVTIFDKSGKALTSKTVSLARLVSSEELKTLSGEEIDRHYQDLSKGSIPPRGATPLMAVFSNLPKGMDEIEVEVVR
ncbi:MAG: DUF3426 domain-containing protein, partial [Proteobacteria bacterium]|nr:DUF3426 domain-containing protein [Pseudomonadota bacterium]